MDKTTIIVIIASVVTLSALAGFIWWYMTKAKYKYIFHVVSRDGKNTRVTKACMIKDPNNKRIKKFSFKENPTLLSIYEPNGHFNGKPVRVVSYNLEGEYVYIKGTTLNESDYLEQSLAPVPKELSLTQMAANLRRNPIVDKAQMGVLVSSIIMLILILGATVYLAATYTKTANIMVSLSEENKKASEAMKSYAELILESNKIFLAASNNLANYCGELSGQDFTGGNLTRSLDPQSTS